MIVAAPQVKAVADIKKNRLLITISGTVETKSLEKLYTEIRFCVADLRPGFKVISDISQCTLLYIGGLPVYKKIVDYLVANKVGEIIRIIQAQNISAKQISVFTGKINSYTPLYASSPQEAEQRLSEIVSRDGIRLKLRHLSFEYASSAGNGKAAIADISISGCAVEKVAEPLPVTTQLEGSIVFPEHPTLIGHVQMKAVVVRSEADRFAVSFLDLSDEIKDQLYQRFVYESSHS